MNGSGSSPKQQEQSPDFNLTSPQLYSYSSTEQAARKHRTISSTIKSNQSANNGGLREFISEKNGKEKKILGQLVADLPACRWVMARGNQSSSPTKVKITTSARNFKQKEMLITDFSEPQPLSPPKSGWEGRIRQSQNSRAQRHRSPVRSQVHQER